MIVPDRRRALILIALYGAILAGWFAFARWVAPPIIASANQGRSSAVLNRLVQDTSECGTPCDNSTRALASLLGGRAARRAASPCDRLVDLPA